jgi:hypothetical protein
MIRLTLFACLLLLVAPLAAQPADAPRDPAALAARYLGVESSAPAALLSRPYLPGERAAFYVSKRGGDQPTLTEATLAAAEPRQLYLWVEAGLDFDPDRMDALAAELAETLRQIRQRANYAPRDSLNAYLGGASDIFDPSNLLPLPDVDGDPHLYILFASDLNSPQTASFNPLDSLPAAYAPFSNQRELIVVNTATRPPEAPFDDAAYASAIARALYLLVMGHNHPDQALWLREALGWYATSVEPAVRLPQQGIAAYIARPATPLIQPLSASDSVAATLGGQQLFLAYLRQRYGEPTLRQLFRTGGEGLAPLDAALMAGDLSDPLTGAPITAAAAFGDFLLANALNLPLGDGRFAHTSPQVPPAARFAARVSDSLDSLVLTDQTVTPFGAVALRLRHPQPTRVEVTFNGQPDVPRFPGAPDNQVYWSGSGRDRNPTLTRAFDLRGVESATLHFDAWWKLAAGWNYGYVAVSTDDGATWTPLPATDTTTANPFGAVYGVGFTGNSAHDAESAGWLPQRVDLTPYAGGQILLRFELVTLPQVNGGGFAIDHLAVPEIDFFDDAEQANGWQLNGWGQVENRIPARFFVAAANTGTTTHPPAVEHLLDSHDTEGRWTLFVEPNEQLVLVIAALHADSDQPARFDLTLSRAASP